MGDGTGISWTDATWNPIRGCSRVSEGCRNCYAERVAARFSKPGQPYHGFAQVVAPRDLLDRVGGRRDGWTRKVAIVAEHLADPLRWMKPRKIFVNSMSDLFHESLTNEQIAAVFGVMAAAPQHTFQVLTKRARRMREWFEWAGDHGSDGARSACRVSASLLLGRPVEAPTHGGTWPLPHVWLGVSVENQAAADERIPELLRTPAALRFLSCEPLLGPLDVRRYLWPTHLSWDSRFATPEEARAAGARAERRRQALVDSGSVFIDWVIAGCESGTDARPCEVEWLRSLRDQCAAAEVPFFLKQVKEPLFFDDREDPREVGYPSGPPVAPTPDPIAFGPGSKRKRGGIIELPYLDGVQHAAFPEVRS